MHLGPVLFLATLQTSLGIGVGTARHAGGSTFGVAGISPALQLLAPSFYVGAGGSLSLLQGGVWAGQARADVWAALPRRRPGVQPALNVTIATTTRSDAVAAASGALLGELVRAGVRGGVALGLGTVAGALEGEPGIGALRVRARGWRQVSAPLQLSLIGESTRFLGAWYHDLVAGALLERARLSASAWVSIRMSRTYGSTGAATASLQYFVTPALALEIAAGSYLRDPFQALPRAGFGSGGIRLYPRARPALRSARGGVSTAVAPGPPPLVAQRRGGDTVVVRFRLDAERSLAIAGDWSGWEPVPLRPLGGDIWEAALLLPSGTYYFNLLVDGVEWVVPSGVAVIPDGMGGLVAVLTVL